MMGQGIELFEIMMNAKEVPAAEFAAYMFQLSGYKRNSLLPSRCGQPPRWILAATGSCYERLTHSALGRPIGPERQTSDASLAILAVCSLHKRWQRKCQAC